MQERGATVAVIGSGGAEAALVHKYSKSPHVKRIIAIPGNDMMQELSEKPVETFQRVAATDTKNISKICRDNQVVLTDLRQEMAIKNGVGDALRRAGVAVVGPSRKAGLLESDKLYARELASLSEIPQPTYKGLRSIRQAYSYLLGKADRKWFVKAAGLAEGKGVISADTKGEVMEAMKRLRKDFPIASRYFLIENGIEGEEVSSFWAMDGETCVHLGDAQDHKRAFDGDIGENTGGMGAVSNPQITKDIKLEREIASIVIRTDESQRLAGESFVGVLFLGAMITEKKPRVKLLEYNARWGDPEAQVIVPGLEVDFFELGMAISEGRLHKMKIMKDNKVRVAVAGVAKGYPGDHSAANNKQIFGLEAAKKIDGVTIYGAAVKVEDEKYYANGGRLFYVVGEGDNVIEAREKAYAAMGEISIEGDNLHYRTDIGWRDVQRIQNGV